MTALTIVVGLGLGLLILAALAACGTIARAIDDHATTVRNAIEDAAKRKD